ncbi:MAG TPA: hypothetical protein VNN08_06090 [Thermoanaerobaculia bacterium]|nr:hypothetical protein [Thermoanaerobaculia bacterium]
MRILLIDDETNLLPEYLEDSGHTCETLRWVRDEEWLRSQLDRVRPKAVILDFAMKPPGSQQYEWIKKWDSATRVVFYTNYAKAGPTHNEMLRVCGEERFIVAKREAAMDVLDIVAVIS